MSAHHATAVREASKPKPLSTQPLCSCPLSSYSLVAGCENTVRLHSSLTRSHLGYAPRYPGRPAGWLSLTHACPQWLNNRYNIYLTLIHKSGVSAVGKRWKHKASKASVSAATAFLHLSVSGVHKWKERCGKKTPKLVSPFDLERAEGFRVCCVL